MQESGLSPANNSMKVGGNDGPVFEALNLRKTRNEVTIKLLNSIGLLFDIVGASLIYIYVFNKPKPLKEQESMPSSSRTEIIGGVEATTIEVGASLDLRAVQINAFNKYKEKLFFWRARFGFCILILGFVLQLVSSFGAAIGYHAILTITLAASFFVFSGFCYFFVYLSNIEGMPPGTGENFEVGRVPVERGVGFRINSDPAFQAWSREVMKYSKRIGLESVGEGRSSRCC